MLATLCKAVLLIVLTVACSPEVVAPGNTATVAAPDAPSHTAAELSPATTTEIVKAPSQEEQLRSCPLAEPDWFDLRARAARRDFAALDAVAEQTLGAYATTVSCEPRVWNLFGFFDKFELSVLDAWVAAQPNSWAAFTARGARWVDLGYERRGPRFSKYVTEEQWKGMRDAFAHAEHDLSRALEINPDAITAYGYAIEMLKATGDERQIVGRLEALLSRDPTNYGVRRRAIESLEPRWGGSIESMREIAEAAQQHAEANPRLLILLGLVEVQNGSQHHLAKRHAEAAAAYRKGLRYGEMEGWYGGLADALYNLEDHQGALEAADRSIEAFGRRSQALAWRGLALVELGRVNEGIASLNEAIALAPTWVWALKQRAFAFHRLGMNTEAAGDLRRALAEGNDTWSLHLLAEIGADDPKSAELARQLVEKDPGNRAAWYLLGTSLSARKDDSGARAAFERYVALANGETDEASRIATARRLMNPSEQGKGAQPALSYGLSAPKP